MLFSAYARRALVPLMFILRAAGMGVVVALLETILVLRAQAVGVSIDVKGPLRALFDAVGGELGWLGVRIVATYACGFALLGALARALQWAVKGGACARWGTFLALSLLLVWRRAVRTPALFDDLPGAEAWLTPLVNHGEPWHPVVVGTALALALAALAVRRRSTLRFGALSALSSLVWLLMHRPLPRIEAKHPLFVVFGIDALRPDRLATGLTPAADAFTRSATMFTRAFTPIAATDGAWRSLLTARYPSEHGVRYSLTADALQNTSYDTFARAFARAGYQTVFATDCSRFHYETEQSGFLVRHQPPRGAVNFLYEKLRFRALPILDLGIVPELTTNRALAGMYDAEADARRIARDLVDRAGRGPLLYAFHATAAHFPGDPQYPFYRMRVPAAEPLAKRLRMQFRPLERREREPIRYPTNVALYDELIAQADMQLAIVLRVLEDSGATIVLLSDHGEDFYDDAPDLAGELSVHGARLNAVQSQVVLAISGAAARAQKNDSFVRLIDVGPTLLELAGLAPLADVPGRSLVPLLRGEALPNALMLAETAFTHAAPNVFNAEHYTGATRTFDAYDLHRDGSVSVKASVHAEIMREKDFGVFDGERWLVRWRDQAGHVHDTCTAEPCDGAWMELLPKD